MDVERFEQIEQEIRELRRQNLEYKHAITTLGNKCANLAGKIVGLEDEIRALRGQGPNNVTQQQQNEPEQTLASDQSTAANVNNANLDANPINPPGMKVEDPDAIGGEEIAPNVEIEQKNVLPILDPSEIADECGGMGGEILPKNEQEDEELELENGDEKEKMELDEEEEGEENSDEEDEEENSDEEDEEENSDEEEKDAENVLKNEKQGRGKRQGQSNNTKKCEYCGKTFKSAAYLRYKHLKLHTGIGLHHCEICNRGFLHPFDVNKHMVVHTGEKPFKCGICGKRFNDKSVCKRHCKQVH